MSDSHGVVQRVRDALAVLDRAQATTIIHCGDVGGIPVLDELVGRDAHFVWGNTDVIHPASLAYLETTGLTAPSRVPLCLELGGKSIQVFHGHEPEFAQALKNPTADYILHGHTHIARDERVLQCRVVNPGALQRAREYTVATIDLEQDEVTFHRL